MITLTKDQENVKDSVLDILHQCNYMNYHWKNHQPLFSTTIGGYAGTGKTTLISIIRKEIKKQFPRLKVAFVTFTGKASSVLKQKLKQEFVVEPEDYAGTIHGLIYKPITQWNKKLKTHVITGWKRKDVGEMYQDIIIIDEASMVSHDIWKDLMKFGKSIIAVGDHGQLPPINNGGGGFNLMDDPEFKLTTIQRQAEKSPIIWLSRFVREHGYIPSNKVFSPDVFKLSWDHKDCQRIWNNVVFDQHVVALCGFNTTRANLNDQIRKKLGFNTLEPYPGERIVCLKNNHTIKIMNGQIGTLLWSMPFEKNLYRMTLQVDGEPDPYECLVHNRCFGQVQYTMYDESKELKDAYKLAIKHDLGNIDFFDYGYVMSVHKSQGSEWDKVIVFEQRTKRWDDQYYARWLYTAITRAREKLFIISDYWG